MLKQAGFSGVKMGLVAKSTGILGKIGATVAGIVDKCAFAWGKRKSFLERR
jgi:hypothetical protein